jgi:hypothetical protein
MVFRRNRHPAVAAVAVAAGIAIGSLGLTRLAPSRQSAAAALPSPRAFARVISDGTFDPAKSKNITSIVKQSTGFYCIKTSVPIRNVIASGNSVTFNTVAEGGLVGATLDSGLGCPAGSKAFVDTFNAATGALQDRPFYVLFN